jgi:hypothetical protein
VLNQLIIVLDGLREDPAGSFTSLGYLDVRRTGTRLFTADGHRHGALIEMIQKGRTNPEGVLLSRRDASEIQKTWWRLFGGLRRGPKSRIRLKTSLGSAVLKYQ